MMKITFEEYQKVYDDVSASEVYDSLYARAEYLLRGFTARRIDDVQSDTDYRYKQVKAAYIHTIHSIATSGQNDDIVSTSNDGYSETYSSAKDRQEGLKAALFDILSGTGLMGCM